jgi:hypothetical protein
MTIFTLAVAAAVPLLAAQDQTKDQPPEAPAPTFAYVSGYDKDKDTLRVRSFVYVPVTKQATRAVVRNGQQVTETYTYTEMAAETRESAYPLKGAQFYDGAGKKLKDDEARDRLKAGRTVLLSQDPKGVDPAYLKVLAKDALIIVPGAPQPDRAPPPRRWRREPCNRQTSQLPDPARGVRPMEERIAKLEKQVRNLHIFYLIVLAGLYFALFWGPLSERLRFSSSARTTEVSEGRLQISGPNEETAVRPAELKLTESERNRVTLSASTSPELRFSMERGIAEGADDGGQPSGGAGAYIHLSDRLNWKRYGASLHFSDDLGTQRGAGNRVSLSTNVYGHPYLQLSSHSGGEISLLFDEKGNPTMTMKTPDGRKRTFSP